MLGHTLNLEMVDLYLKRQQQSKASEEHDKITVRFKTLQLWAEIISAKDAFIQTKIIRGDLMQTCIAVKSTDISSSQFLLCLMLRRF